MAELDIEPSRPDRAWRFGLVAIALAALAARLIGVVLGGGLTGDLGYDDGVYYAAASSLIHGALPYRDFLFVHPPGILLLLAPFALIGSVVGDATGMAVARVAFVSLGALTAVLVAVLASRASRSAGFGGRVAGLAAGFVYALWPVPVSAAQTTTLMAPQALLLTAALLVLARPVARDARTALRDGAIAGGLIGLDVSIKVWALVPAVVIGLWLLVEIRPWRWARRREAAPQWRREAGPLRRLAGFLAGAAAVATVVMLPFLLVARRAMFRMIVLDQLHRPREGLALPQRLASMELGLVLPQGQPELAVAVVALAVAATIGAVVLAVRVPAVRLWLAIAAVEIGLLLVSMVFFRRYAAWPAPLLALTAGVAIARLAAFARVRGATVTRVALGLGVAAVVGAGVVDAQPIGKPIDRAALERDLAASRCVVADRLILLIETNALARSLADGCEVVVDPLGIAFDGRRGRLKSIHGRPRARAYQALAVRWYGQADAALFTQLKLDAFTHATWAEISCRLPLVQARGSVMVLQRAATQASCP